MPEGIELILQERRHHREQGWTPESESRYDRAEMAYAAACFAAPEALYVARSGTQEKQLKYVDAWPSNWEDKRPKYDRIRQLQIAGALIVAEIERLQRLR